jgi:hypothetical protein
MIKKISITSKNSGESITLEAKDYRGYCLGTVDWGQVEGEHQTYSYYNQIGVNIVSTTVGTRPISITGWVIEDQETMQERCDFLNVFLSPLNDYTLTYGDKKIDFRPDRSIQYSRDFKSNNLLLRKFLIQGTAPYPLFSKISDTEVTFEDNQKLFHFPTDFGYSSPLVFGLSKRSFNAEVNNTGGFPTGFMARMEFKGHVTNPRIENLKTGQLIGVNYEFARGDELEICTLLGSKSMELKVGESAVNLIKFRDYRTTWLQLEPGLNRLAVSCDQTEELGNITISIFFTPLYMEVE